MSENTRWEDVFKFSPKDAPFCLVVTHSTFKCLPEGYARYFSRAHFTDVKRLVCQRVAPFYWQSRGDYLIFELRANAHHRGVLQICTLNGQRSDSLTLEISNLPRDNRTPTFSFISQIPR